MADSTLYIDAKARVVRAINRVTTFVRASIAYQTEPTNALNRAKIGKMLRELDEIRRHVESDIQVMESAVSNGTAPSDVTSNECSNSLIDSFDTMYYDLAAFGDIHKLPLNVLSDSSVLGITSSINQSVSNNLSSFQLPKRKFPTFSGLITDWQGFEDLFLSILSHVPELPDVERFEYLKTSLSGEALSIISHLSLTDANYKSAWEILRARYGNKRDLARVHLDALLSPHVVKSNNASSIKNLINCILEHTAALDNLGFTTRSWSPILIHLCEKYLDYELRSRWELVVGEKHLPQTKEFVEFLRSHIRSAEICSSSVLKPKSTGIPSNSKPRYGVTQKVLAASTNQPVTTNCQICSKPHPLRKCSLFTDKSSKERFQIAKLHRLCINCLGSGHPSANCTSKYKCQTCNRSHHTLLHFDTEPPLPTISTEPPSKPIQSTSALVVKGQSQMTVLLSTVLLDVHAANGRCQSFRALLDSGSQASFITEKVVDTLMIPRRQSPINITTFASTTSARVKGKSSVTITPCGQRTPTFSLDVLIVPVITGPTPQLPITPRTWSHIKDLTLADPSYHTPGAIDLLLGADILPILLQDGKRTGQVGEPMALETVLGWVLMGATQSIISSSVTSLCLSVSESLDNTLKQFWEVEELSSTRHTSPDDIIAENIYKTTTTRLSSGRFMVSLPFRINRPLLGNSKSVAMQRFRALESRLIRNKDLYQQYSDFMLDYLNTGHMESIPEAERENPYHYYIPHHCVLKPESSTTKLRVVFNASSRTSTGTSLNESMYIGPKLQPDIQVVLLHMRLWKYVFTADIKQMYRQILVRPDDRDYQRILWRFSPTSPIDEYRLCTVTYGLSAAPYQALRTIRELAIIDGPSLPLAANVLLNDTFVDDVLTGANSVPDALDCQAQLIKLCSFAQFELRKWASNCQEILQTVPEDSRLISPSVLIDHSEQTGVKVLGLRWDPVLDTFSFNVLPSATIPTKRAILSDIARVFDPLGLLSPITFWTKHVMQRLWTAGLTWDEPVPADIALAWTKYQSELHFIENISITRRLTFDHSVSAQLHAFSDSSEKGYAAAVYLRIETQSDTYCHLVIGKSKVSPLKRITIPRLELCGAVLAANLLHFVVNTLKPRITIENSYAWSDSTTALAWIRSSPHRWATFVANRTSQIQELTSPSMWHHVPTHLNPVDCASRGLLPSEIINHPLWWTGPPYLLEPQTKWPTLNITTNEDNDETVATEMRKIVVCGVTLTNEIFGLMDKFSSLSKILRILAYCLRLSKSRPTVSFTINIDASEMEHSLLALVYSVQQTAYKDDIMCLAKGLRCSKNIRMLDPFVDEHGLIRVGGRLRHSDLPYAHKHPLLLPSHHRLTELLIDHHHHRLKHPGSTALQAHLRESFWIQSARQAIRSRVKRCIACFRIRPKPVQPKMGDLPKYRIQQIKPFAICGVDYAGPLTIKESRGRRVLSTTAYICLFVCTTTKAIHLEVSSNLSTEKFLMAFTRFASRRGPIQEIHSDCGTNFVGAARLLTPLQELTHSQGFQDKVHNHLSKQHIRWCFNPPASPHFGGLWEAGVKSTKNLLLRTVGSHKLTNEELTTLLTQIEATLNSRPLCPLSNDPTDFEALTPSHFLTLEPTTQLPETRLEALPLSKMQRWRLVTDIHRHFWSRWKLEYLSSLQIRQKWSENGNKLKVGDLVLIKEATHPLHWLLGRIMNLHPGSDGISRVATVRTATGSLKRPAVKLCPLPIC